MIKKVTKIKMSLTLVNRVEQKTTIVYLFFVPIYKSTEEFIYE